MNNKLAAFIVVLSLGQSAVFAQDAAQYQFQSQDPSLAEEAGQAVVGRVFGLKDQGGDIRYYTFDHSSHSRPNAVLRSALIPGWGQHFNREPVKGTVLFFTTTLAAVGSLVMYEKSQDSFDQYEQLGIANGTDFDDYERERNQSLILGTVAVGLYIFGLVDAYRKAYNPLWSTKSQSVKVVSRKDLNQIQFQRRF